MQVKLVLSSEHFRTPDLDNKYYILQSIKQKQWLTLTSQSTSVSRYNMLKLFNKFQVSYGIFCDVILALIAIYALEFLCFPMSLSDFLENVITVLLLQNELNCTRSSVHKVTCNIQLIFYAIYILKAPWLKVTVANDSLVTNN